MAARTAGDNRDPCPPKFAHCYCAYAFVPFFRFLCLVVHRFRLAGAFLNHRGGIFDALAVRPHSVSFTTAITSSRCSLRGPIALGIPSNTCKAVSDTAPACLNAANRRVRAPTLLVPPEASSTANKRRSLPPNICSAGNTRLVSLQKGGDQEVAPCGIFHGGNQFPCFSHEFRLERSIGGPGWGTSREVAGVTLPLNPSEFDRRLESPGREKSSLPSPARAHC